MLIKRTKTDTPDTKEHTPQDKPQEDMPECQEIHNPES